MTTQNDPVAEARVRAEARISKRAATTKPTRWPMTTIGGLLIAAFMLVFIILNHGYTPMVQAQQPTPGMANINIIQGEQSDRPMLRVEGRVREGQTPSSPAPSGRAPAAPAAQVQAQPQNPAAQTARPPAQQATGRPSVPCADVTCNYNFRVFAVRGIDLNLRQQLTSRNSGEVYAPPGSGAPANSRNLHQEVPGWVRAGLAQYVGDCQVRARLHREVRQRDGQVLPGDMTYDFGMLSPINGQYFAVALNKEARVGQMLVLTSEDNCFRAGAGSVLYFYSVERRRVLMEGAFFTSDTFCTPPVRVPAGRRATRTVQPQQC